MYYLESGNRNASRMIVFLHGGGVSSWMWDRQKSYFSEDYCLFPDLPGHGLSELSDVFSITRTANELNRFIQHHAEGREIVVVGFSLGAQVLVEMISQEPDLIHHAMINSALVRPMRRFKPFIASIVRWSYPLIKNRAFSRMQSKTLYISEEDFEKYYAEATQMKMSTLISVLEENMTYSIPAGFRDAQTNLLITVGAKEKRMMRQSARDLKSSSAKVSAVSFNEIGHGASMASPDLFNQLLESWLGQKPLPEGVSIL